MIYKIYKILQMDNYNYYKLIKIKLMIKIFKIKINKIQN